VHCIVSVEFLQQFDNARVLRGVLQDLCVLFALLSGDEASGSGGDYFNGDLAVARLSFA